MSPERSRVEKRKDLPESVRLALMEDDLDSVNDGLDALNDKLGKIMWAMVGMLISISTASVLLVLNLVVK